MRYKIDQLKEKIKKFIPPMQIETKQFFDDRELTIQENGFLDDTTNVELEAEIDTWMKDIELRGNTAIPIIVSGRIKWGIDEFNRWQYNGKVNGRDHWKPKV